MRVPYAFVANYLDDVVQVAELVDDVMRGQVAAAPGAMPVASASTLSTSQPAISNGLVKLILLSVLSVIGVAVLPISILVVLVPEGAPPRAVAKKPVPVVQPKAPPPPAAPASAAAVEPDRAEERRR